MFNKCGKCGRVFDINEPRKLVLDANGLVATKCIRCYEQAIIEQKVIKKGVERY
jgi:hypothetical protein